MSEIELMQKFQEYCLSTGVTVEDLGSEMPLMGCFLRKDFAAKCLTNASFSDLTNYIEMVFKLSETEKVDQTVPFLLIEDLVEMGSYSALEHLLPYLDAKSNSWMSKLSSKKGAGLILLRSVNLLRRKIVRSEHSKLAGLSLLLLTKIFPASERSGVNLRGERNTDNKNLKACTDVDGVHDEYSYFCSLHQMFYLSPIKLCDKENWKSLCQAVEKILRKIETATTMNPSTGYNIGNENLFSSQHLFTEKSYELQIDDHCFRLSLLAQILVLLQDVNYVANEQNNSKSDFKIEENQEMWIAETTKKTYYLISLHNFGKEYFRFLRSISRNEKKWIMWKNNSCPSLEKDAPNLLLNSETGFPSILVESLARFNMGDEELARLWKYSLEEVDNRRLKPDVAEYQLNSQTEDCTPDSNTLWRANRLSWKLNL